MNPEVWAFREAAESVLSREVHPDRLMCQAETREECDIDSHWEAADA